MTAIVSIPVPDQQLPEPTVKPSAGFLRENGRPALLTTPSKLALAAADLSGSGNAAGALNGGITATQDGFGALKSAWKLDGASTTHIDFNTSITSVGTGDFTAVVLCRLDANLDNAGAFGCFNGSAGFFIDSRAPSSTLLPQFYCGGGSAVGTTNLRDGKYHLIVGTRLSGSCDLYCDGVSQATFTGSASLGTGTLRIGNRGDLSSSNWNGVVAFASFFRFALAADQVSSLYQSLLTGQPYRLFEPQTRDIVVGSASGAAASGAGALIATNSLLASSLYSAVAGIATSLATIASSLQSAAAGIHGISAEVASSIISATMQLQALSAQTTAIAANAVAGVGSASTQGVLANLVALQEHLSSAATFIASSLYGSKGAVSGAATARVSYNLLSVAEQIEAMAAWLANSIEATQAGSGASATVIASSIYGAVSRCGASAVASLAGVAPNAPGLEFTLGASRLHYSLPSNLLGYTMPVNRLHYTPPGDN